MRVLIVVAVLWRWDSARASGERGTVAARYCSRLRFEAVRGEWSATFEVSPRHFPFGPCPNAAARAPCPAPREERPLRTESARLGIQGIDT